MHFIIITLLVHIVHYFIQLLILVYLYTMEASGGNYN